MSSRGEGGDGQYKECITFLFGGGDDDMTLVGRRARLASPAKSKKKAAKKKAPAKKKAVKKKAAKKKAAPKRKAAKKKATRKKKK